MHTAPNTAGTRLAVDEKTLAEAIGMSVAWLRKDRSGARIVPFYRLGSSVRYSIDRVREALDKQAEGGAR